MIWLENKIEFPCSTETSVHEEHEFRGEKKILVAWFSQELFSKLKKNFCSWVYSGLQIGQVSGKGVQGIDKRVIKIMDQVLHTGHRRKWQQQMIYRKNVKNAIFWKPWCDQRFYSGSQWVDNLKLGSWQPRVRCLNWWLHKWSSLRKYKSRLWPWKAGGEVERWRIELRIRGRGVQSLKSVWICTVNLAMVIE